MKKNLLPVFVFSLYVLNLLSGCGGGSTASKPLTIAPASLPNGISQVTYSQSIKASGGIAPFTWTVSAGALPHNLTLSTTSGSGVTISGTPDTPTQAVSFTVKVTDFADQSAIQSYTVSILLEPDALTFTPPSLVFIPQLVGTVSDAQSVTLTNTGSSAVAITGISVTGSNAPDFSLNNTCGSGIPAGANCIVNVTVAPSQPGPRSAAIVITDNTVGSPHSISIDGVGVNPVPNATLSATILTFADQVIGTASAVQSFTLSNFGTGTLNIVRIATSANFGETSDCGPTLATGATCNINVRFTPAASGTLSGTVSIADNAADSPQIVLLSGTGIAGRCTARGQQCSSRMPCCPGLVCIPASVRAFCEPRTSLKSVEQSSYSEQLNLNRF